MAKQPFIPYAPRPDGWVAPLSKSKAEAVAADRNGSVREVAARHDVSRATVSRIRNEGHWLFHGPNTELRKNGVG